MSWDRTTTVIDYSKIITNVLEFIETNQTDALKSVNDENSLPSFKRIFRSAKGRIVSVFPNLMLIEKTFAYDDTETVLRGALSLIFEGQLQGGDPDVLSLQSEVYVLALQRMVYSMNSAELANGIPNIAKVVMLGMEAEFTTTQGNAANTQFLQIFQTGFIFDLYGE